MAVITAAVGGALSSFCTKCPTLDTKLQELQTLCDSLSSEKTDAELQLQFKARRLEEVERQHRDTLQKAESLTERLGSLETQTQSWEFKASQLQSAMERVKGEAAALRSELSGCSRERDEWKGACTEWKELAERNKAVCTELLDKRRELEQYVRELEAGIGKYSSMMASVNERNAELVLEKAKLVENVGEWEEKGEEWERKWRGMMSWLRMCPISGAAAELQGPAAAAPQGPVVVTAVELQVQAVHIEGEDGEFLDPVIPESLDPAESEAEQMETAILPQEEMGTPKKPENPEVDGECSMEVIAGGRRVTEGGSVAEGAVRRDSAPRHSSGTQLADEGESCEVMEELPDFLGAMPGTFAGGYLGGESVAVVHDNHSVIYM